MNSVYTLAGRLRHSTRDLHDRVEATVGLERRVATADDYRRLLERMLGLHAPYETALARVAWGDLDLNLPARRKAGLIAADLVDLGASAEEIAALPALSPTPVIPDRPAALGVLYVLEGSTLGGKYILRDISARLDVRANRGGRFFASYGPRVGAMWRECIAALDTIPAASPAAEEVERSAVETFIRFESWLNESDT
jgi:heme oxygenase